MYTAHERPGQSGTGEVTELAYGKYSVETVYSDMDVEKIKSIPPTAFHRNVDREVIRADEEGADTSSALTLLAFC